MRRRKLIETLSWLIVGMGAPGCYADEVPSPEPTLTTPGAFIAVPFEPALPSGAAGQAGQPGDAPPAGSGAGGATTDGELYRLIRVLAVLDVKSDFAVFHLQYGLVESLERAREATQARPSGPPPPLGIMSLGRLEALGAVVVGYRSLTEEELEVIR